MSSCFVFFFFYTYIPALFFIKCHHPKSRPQSNFHLPIRHICVQTNNIFSHLPTYNVVNQPQTKALSNRFTGRVCYQLLLEMEREYASLFLFSSCTGQPGETGGSPAIAPPLLCWCHQHRLFSFCKCFLPPQTNHAVWSHCCLKACDPLRREFQAFSRVYQEKAEYWEVCVSPRSWEISLMAEHQYLLLSQFLPREYRRPRNCGPHCPESSGSWGISSRCRTPPTSSSSQRSLEYFYE